MKKLVDMMEEGGKGVRVDLYLLVFLKVGWDGIGPAPGSSDCS